MTQLLPHAYLTWDQSAVGIDTFVRYQVYRRPQGTTEWIHIANIPDRAVVYYHDYAVLSGVASEYAVTQIVISNGEEVESAFPVPVACTVSFKSAFLHAIGNPSYWAEIPHQSVRVEHMQDTELIQPYSLTRPILHVGNLDALQVTISASWPDTENLWETLRGVVDRQRLDGTALCIRTGRGLRVFCGVTRHSKSDTRPILSGHSLTLPELNYSEVLP